MANPSPWQPPPPADPHFHILAKPTGAVCNLSCKYCFFLSKDSLYPGSKFRMDDATQENYIRQLLASSPGPEVQIAWQGGEPTLMGLDFFRRAVDLAAKFKRPGQEIQHVIQTNGLLIDDTWAVFLKRNRFLVGLSIDGTRECHDAYRIDKAGAGTHERVVKAWRLLQRHGVDVNILCTLHTANQGRPLEIYKYFRDELGARYIQFIPIVERATAENLELANMGWGERPSSKRPLYKREGNLVTERTVNAEAFGKFLIAIFDEWVKRDVGTVYVTTFDVALGSWLGQHNQCITSPTCGAALALEHTGDLYSCDHFVEPEFKLGNINSESMKGMIVSEKQRDFGQHKFDSLPKYCKECPVLFACFGECPRNRFIETPAGEKGLNWLCAGYKAFYTHITPAMNTMAGLLREGRYADEIMGMGND